MKINAVITQNALKNKRITLKGNAVSIFTFLVSSISVFCGVLFYILFKELLDPEINNLFLEFTNDFITKSKPEIFTGLLLNTLLFFLVVLLLSTSVIGDALIYSIIFVKILSISVLVSYIYSLYGLKGIEYCILILFPGKFIFLLSVILICDFCVHISKSIRKKKIDEKTDTKKQMIRILVISVFALVNVTVDFLTNIIFSGLFDF